MVDYVTPGDVGIRFSSCSSQRNPITFHAMRVGCQPPPVFKRLPAWVLLLLLGGSLKASGGGVTIITHGLNSNTDTWVLAMAHAAANHYRFPGTSVSIYKLLVSSSPSRYMFAQQKLAGGSPLEIDSGELIILLDWGQLADGGLGLDEHSTADIAAGVEEVLVAGDFIPELGGRALAQFPLHLIGHSRGGSLVCEIARLLGRDGVWVDHLTTVDPHPLNNDGFLEFPVYTVVDASASVYENTFFADNYWQDLNVLAPGESVQGAYNRKLTNLDGGYGTITASHNDVHLWYHGTVDSSTPASDTEASITEFERSRWWTPYEMFGIRAGFYYSLIGGGNRFSAAEPAGVANGRIVDGINGVWDLGAGQVNNRHPLTARRGTWPNIIRLNLTGSNYLTATNAAGVEDGQVFVFEQTDSIELATYIQCGTNDLEQATMTLALDRDYNPFNGNDILLDRYAMKSTGPSLLRRFNLTVQLNRESIAPGHYSLLAELACGTNRRFFYAAEKLVVFPSLTVAISARLSDNQNVWQIRATGAQALDVAIEHSPDLKNWIRSGSQRLTGAAGSVVGTADFDQTDSLSSSALFYRAVYTQQ